MRVLVTGSAGFLGRHFVRAHLADGDEVLGIDDLSATGPLDAPGDVMRITTVEDVLTTFTGPFNVGDFDLAYHFAAPVGGRVKIEQDPLFNAHSLALDEAFFRWAIKHAKRVVYPSSSAVYGRSLQGRDALSLQEGMFHPGNPNWFAPDEMYGFTKLAGEMLAWKAETYGLASLCIRPFSGYGEGQSFDYPVPAIAARALKREDPLIIWGSGDQARDFIHVDDIVTLTRARVAAGFGGYNSMNLGSGRATTFREVAEVLAREVGYEPEIQTDQNKPEGVKRRWAHIARQDFYGATQVRLIDGLRRVLVDVERRISVEVPA